MYLSQQICPCESASVGGSQGLSAGLDTFRTTNSTGQTMRAEGIAPIPSISSAFLGIQPTCQPRKKSASRPNTFCIIFILNDLQISFAPRLPISGSVLTAGTLFAFTS